MLCLTFAGMAQAQTELQRLFASDGAPEDQFGSAVSISGDVALVGARYDDDFGVSSGSAYVFERDEQGMWSEVAKLTASDASRFDQFGESVALMGDVALVGALRNEANDRSGSVYVFERDELGMWPEVAKLTASDNEAIDSFGNSMALLGDVVLVGASGEDDAGLNSGSAYVFERDELGMWSEVAKLTASDAAEGDSFGVSLALSGNAALVGVTGDDDAGVNSGSVYVFERDAMGVWVEVVKLNASDAAAGDLFGRVVALSGDVALVGTSSDASSVYLFERSEQGMWSQVAKFSSDPDAEESDFFGYSVALSGDVALVGALFDTDAGFAAGSAYVFERDEQGMWSEVSKFAASDTEEGDLFGFSVALQGDVALVGGGYDDNDNGGFDSGSVYEFDVGGLGDQDEDGIIDAEDNCPTDFNPLQQNFDEDRQGDVCDQDDDDDGVDDTSDPFPLDPIRPGYGGSLSLELGSVDSNHYGFRFGAIGSNRKELELQFDASGSDLFLTVTGFDIDTNSEITVFVNDTEIGNLKRTPNNGFRETQLTISQSLLNSAGNTLRFEQLNPGWRWGVTDLLLSDTNGFPSLELGSVDSNHYGFRFGAIGSNRKELELQFDASGSDLFLKVTGFDIDTNNEITVIVNDIEIGNLKRTPNNGFRETQLTISQNLLNSSGNTLRFEQLNPGWRWGVTDLLLSANGVNL